MYESSKEKISFLDLSVSLCNGNLYTDLHIKATDCHQHLEYTSSHPEHSKKSIIYSQTLRLVGFANLNKNLKATKEIWDHGLLKGDTQRELLIRKCRRSSLIFLRKLILRKRCFLVVTYHPNLNCLSKIIRDNLYLLYMKLKRSFLWNLWYLWEAQGN